MRPAALTVLSPRAAFAVLVAAVVSIVAMWILVTPIAGGPDEPAHLVRAAAIGRLDVGGTELPDATRPDRLVRVFEVPRWLHIETPCYALQEEQPASCAPALDGSGGTIRLATSAWDYPIWGHVLPGVGSHVPSTTIAPLLMRALSAALPVLLVSLALLAVRGRAPLAGAALLAVTPMAWFTFAVVNPSAPSIAGGFALWVGLLLAPGASREAAVRWAPWLMAAGWAALALPRRDGLIWACSIVAIWAAVHRTSLMTLWQRLGRGPQAVVAASTAATLVWAATSGSRVSRALLVVPVVLAVFEFGRSRWDRAVTAAQRAALVAAGVALVVAGAVITLVARPGGADVGLATRIVNDTGRDVFEAVGLMGWLDTPIPLSVFLLYLIVLGMLAGAALAGGAVREQQQVRRSEDVDLRLVGGAAAVTVTAIGLSWVLELFSGNTTGTYWQGRYYLPLVMGVPLLLGAARMEPMLARRLGWVAAVTAGVVVNAGFLASARRWGVGTNGSVWPWDWHTYGALVHPMALAALHTVAWAVLIVVAMGAAPAHRRAAAVTETPTSPSSRPSAPASTP